MCAYLIRQSLNLWESSHAKKFYLEIYKNNTGDQLVNILVLKNSPSVSS